MDNDQETIVFSMKKANDVGEIIGTYHGSQERGGKAKYKIQFGGFDGMISVELFEAIFQRGYQQPTDVNPLDAMLEELKKENAQLKSAQAELEKIITEKQEYIESLPVLKDEEPEEEPETEETPEPETKQAKKIKSTKKK